MIGRMLAKVFGTKNDREIKRITPTVYQINALEERVKAIPTEQFPEKIAEFKKKIEAEISQDRPVREILDEVLPEVFAYVREASIRTIGLRHFDVQLLGGIVLHEGKIAEMKTGEGKTLVATLPLVLNALVGRGANLVTVNDYLARRDTEWMGPIYRALGLNVGVIVHGLSDSERREAYACDITYGTNNEFGFDYLRDNMKLDSAAYVQRDYFYAIVDEVDSILIDEARTPLIISGPTEDNTEKYYIIDRIIPGLKKETHYTIDEKARNIMLTEEGVEKVQRSLNVDNLYDPNEIETLHHVDQALRAHVLYKRDVDYIVKDGKVFIVDEFTGRLMPGRRWSDGLHQAVEAKEKVRIENENQTLATITFQNFFRMYEKLAGMTGTADTEAIEFRKIYNLEVLVIPTNMPMIRIDNPDMIYRTEKEKFRAVADEIADCYERGQPVLVGTISIEKSERLSKMLKMRGIPHEVLNAKQHEREAYIVAQAGRFKSVTIATNMAGRGTDIVLGGNPEMLVKASVVQSEEGVNEEEINKLIQEAKLQCEKERKQVLEAGGVHILGTERHESRRIDNQLRGRSGRQGDPGSSRFYLSLEDDLMRIFGSERIDSILKFLGIKEDEPIYHPRISKAIESAQKRVEAHNFDIRKHLLDYDDVMNQQRKVIYQQRREILTGQDVSKMIEDMLEEVAEWTAAEHADQKSYPEEWDMNGLKATALGRFGILIPTYSEDNFLKLTFNSLINDAIDIFKKAYHEKEAAITSSVMRDAEKYFLLTTIDMLWKDHLLGMDNLRQGIGLRGYGQRDPLQEYKREAFELFTEMVGRIKDQTVEKLFRFQIQTEAQEKLELKRRRRNVPLHYGREDLVKEQRPEAEPDKPKGVTVRRTGKKIGPNDPCPCGSGKKYKKCCRDKTSVA